MVATFDELTSQGFQGQTNAVCWYRNLEGDFKEIVSKLESKDNVTDISIPELLALTLSQQGSIARKIIFDDLKLLKDLGAKPALNLIKCYERDEEYNFISTDVYSYHVDRSPIPTDTFYVLIMERQRNNW